MTPAETLMREWLASGDPAKVRHAEARLKLPFDGPPPMPPLLQQAGNLARSLAAHVAAGLPKAADDALAARLAACAGCDRRTPEGRCSACGCVLSLKASWAGESCPLGRWPG